MNSKINFFLEFEAGELKILKKGLIRLWIEKVISNQEKKGGVLNFIFSNDDGLLKLNQKYLNHSKLTDILTFPAGEETEEISGDIYISVERVKENAEKFKETFKMELLRVMIHGVLHLLGLRDKTKAEKNEMRRKENEYIRIYLNIEERPNKTAPVAGL